MANLRKTIGKLAARVALRLGGIRQVRGKFDVAQTNTENARHWANADNLSANAAASPGVRRIIRNRARYEVANSSHARGILNTLADDVVGTGPRLQMLIPDGDEINRRIESAWKLWADSRDLATKLRTLRLARCQDGESFGVIVSNPNLTASPISLDLQIREADFFTDPTFFVNDGNTVDGIIFDEYGNPKTYRMLKQHPGGNSLLSIGGHDDVPAEDVIHWFRPDRPGQSRGVSEIATALPLFAQLRRYTLAVIAAAESAANFAGILYSDLPPNTNDDTEADPWESIELERNMLVTMPAGYKMEQVKAEQPSTTYGEFKREILNEIARCLSMPYNIAACNSSSYNYSSGRLDHQTYVRTIAIDRASCTRVILDRLFSKWMTEAVLIEGFLPQVLRRIGAQTPHTWHWDNRADADPIKAAKATEILLKSDATTLADEYAYRGHDWSEKLTQRKREKERLATHPQPPAPAAKSPQEVSK